jgi:hypothetical protein
MEEQMWLFPDFFSFETLCDTCDAEVEFEYESFVHSIYPDVTELEFRYYGKRGADEDAEWYETWNSFEDLCSCDPGMIQKSLPQKVEVKIVKPKIIAKEDEEEKEEIIFEVPIESMQEN